MADALVRRQRGDALLTQRAADEGVRRSKSEADEEEDVKRRELKRRELGSGLPRRELGLGLRLAGKNQRSVSC